MKKNDSNNRNSAIELLRIISIIFVILRHYYTQADWGGYKISLDNWTWRTLFLQLITIGGSTANNIFLLISGYYMIGTTVNWKRILKLTLELFFYSWIIAFILFSLGIVPFSVKELIKALIPIWFGYNWYICCYIIFCCFLPFINLMLEHLNRELYRKFLMVSLFIWSFAYTFRATNYLGSDFSVDHFLFIYALGGYIRRYNIKINRNWNTYCILLTIVMISSVIILSLGGAKLNINEAIIRATYFSHATNIIDVLWATTIFCAVINYKPYYNKIINFISKSVLGIFLIHHNPLLKNVIWNSIVPNKNFINSSWLPMHCVIKVIIVFLCCLLIDQIRLLSIDKILCRLLDLYWEKMIIAFSGNFNLLYARIRKVL